MERQGEGPIQSVPGLTEGDTTDVIESATNGHSPAYDIEVVAESKKEEKTRFTVPVILFFLTSITTLLSGSYFCVLQICMWIVFDADKSVKRKNKEMLEATSEGKWPPFDHLQLNLLTN